MKIETPYFKNQEYLALHKEYGDILQEEKDFEKKCADRKKEIRARMQEIKWGKKLDLKVGIGVKIFALIITPIIIVSNAIVSIFDGIIEYIKNSFQVIKMVLKLKTNRDLYL